MKKKNQIIVKAKKHTRIREGMATVKPVYMRKLVDSEGGQKAVADMLGTSDALISDSLRKNATRPAYEIAAKAIFSKKYPKSGASGDRISAIISADSVTVDFVRSLIEKAGGKLVEVAV